MTVSGKISLSDYRHKNRLIIETTLQDFEKRQLLAKLHKPLTVL